MAVFFLFLNYKKLFKYASNGCQTREFFNTKGLLYSSTSDTRVCLTKRKITLKLVAKYFTLKEEGVKNFQRLSIAGVFTVLCSS